ncbi:T9SS type A sorting domain-containing protein [Marixanthomonas ophiurae]|uniref:T9SS C-terminal target domain-containing protein n=1 Tax=Marixanthomonas ophiurae TaxID=387659 RepID=A0A3E1Q6P5_9FLAO|nr:T9SS type A sorting domain-containing protein [Marixanthomonas ophiurae]RFN57805.1 T9SS C-terminal target domain-containing protein [Marixanthomonas ophiurae]
MKKLTTLLLLFFYILIVQKITAQVELEGAKDYGQLFNVTYSETEEDVIYARTVTNHIVTSTDGGDNWSVLYAEPLDKYATLKDLKLINDGTSLSFIVSAEGTDYNAIVLFDLATETITRTYSPPNSFETDILIESYDILESNNDIALMHTTYSLGGAYTHEVFYTGDGGANWFPVYYSPINDNVAINNVAISPAEGETLFLMRGGSTSRVIGGLFVSTDAGQTWEEKIPGNMYDPISFNPNNADDILLGTGYGYDTHVENLYRSTNGGDTWNIVPITWTTMSQDNINEIAFNPTNTNEIMVLEENEIVVSSDNGTTWQNYVYNDIDPETYYYGLTASYNPFVSREVLISTNYYPFLSEDGGATLSKLENPFINSSGTVASFTSEDENHVYYGLRSGYIHKDLQTETEEGYGLQSLEQGFGSPLKVYADPVVSGRVFTNNRVVNTSYLSVSAEHGADSKLIASSMFFLILEDVSTSVTNPNISWLSTGIEAHKVDLTDMENIIDTNIPVPQTGEVVTAVQVDREDEATIYITQDVSFYKSSNDGAIWELAVTGLEELVSRDDLILDIEQNPLNANQLMLATTNGIYLSENKGDSWSLISSEFTNDVAFSTVTEDAIVAVTHYSDGFNIPLPEAKAKIIFSKDMGETWEEITPEMLNYSVTETSAFTFTEDAVDVYLGVQDLGLVKYNIDLTTLSITSEIVENKIIALYPNPAKDSFSINSYDRIEAVTIYNMAGQEVKKVSETNQEINISDLANGLYIVKVKTSEGTLSKRIIKAN